MDIIASVVSPAALWTGVPGRDPASDGFANLDPLAGARLGMGGGVPVTGAGEVVRDGGPTGVPGRESGSAIRSGSVEECRLWPEARGGMRGGVAWLFIDSFAGEAGEGTGEGADERRALNFDSAEVTICSTSLSFEGGGAGSSDFRVGELVAAGGLELPEVILRGTRSTLRLGTAGRVAGAGSAPFGSEDG